MRDDTTTRDAFAFAAGYGPVLGSTGTLRQFKVAVETKLTLGDGI
jgi:hypothetical protein